jgi:hypothetical protein
MIGVPFLALNGVALDFATDAVGVAAPEADIDLAADSALLALLV